MVEVWAFISVSYTHLDVYKRQVWAGTWPHGMAMLMAGIAYDLEAVSYTHLDVYKRQSHPKGIA